MRRLRNPSDQDITSQTPHNCNLVQLSMSRAQTDNHVAKCDQLKNYWWLLGGELALEKHVSLDFMGQTIKKGNLENSIN